jgi:hypothetical protein
MSAHISDVHRSPRRSRLSRRRVGTSAVAAILATAAVGAAAPVQAAVASQSGAETTMAHKAPYFKTTMRVSPGTVSQGARVTISGDAGTPLRAGTTITFVSFAFASRYHVDGVPAVRTQVFTDGTYRATARIQSGLRHTRYAVDASANGKSVGPVVWMNVRRASHKAPTFKTTMNVSPGTVRSGGRVTISGDAGTPLSAGTTITLQSFAFASRYHLDGVPAVRTQVFADGTYRVTARIRTGIRHTNYAIDASAQGKEVGPVVWLNVR